MTKVTMPDPVAWRSRYCSPQGMIGHYPWSYVEHSLRQPALNNYDIESLITTDQAEAYAAARVREALEEVIQRLEAESAIAREHKAYAAVLALMSQAELIRVSIGKQ